MQLTTISGADRIEHLAFFISITWTFTTLKGGSQISLRLLNKLSQLTPKKIVWKNVWKDGTLSNYFIMDLEVEKFEHVLLIVIA